MNLPAAIADPFPAEARLDFALRAGRLGYWDLDSAGRFTSSAQHNANCGLPAGEPLTYAQFIAAVHPDDHSRVDRMFASAVRDALPIDAEIRVIWPDGQIHWLRLGGQRIAGEPNASERVVGISFDITGRKAMEARLREETVTLDTLNRVGRMLAGELDLKRVVQSVTDAATALSGAQFGAFFHNVIDEKGGSYALYTVSGLPPEVFSQFPTGAAIFAPAFHGEGVIRCGDIRKDMRIAKLLPEFAMLKGNLSVVSCLAVPVVSRSGEVIGGLFFGHEEPDMFTERAERVVAGIASQAAIAIDNARLYQSAQTEIAERRRAEGQQKLLMDELNHRVRNMLAIVLAIANQTLRHAASSVQFRADFEARVTALSAAHNLLTASNWEGALLCDIVESVLKPFATPPQHRVKLTGEPVRVGPKFAVSLLMAFHELATNAVKYGALSNETGGVTVTWSLSQAPSAPALSIEWRESGGPPVKPRRRRGFGSRLIDGLSAETNGNVGLQFERGGVVCSIEVPLPPDGQGISRA